jgi:hypothetical protein
MDAPRATTLADRLDWLQRHVGLKRTAFAKRVGVAPSSLALMHKNGVASESSLLRMSRALGASYEWLRTGAGTPFGDAGRSNDVSTPDAVRYFAAAIGLPADLIDDVVAQAAPGTEPELLVDRMRAAHAHRRMQERSPGAAVYEAAAAFARSMKLPTANIVAVMDAAIEGEFATPLECFQAMLGDEGSAAPPPSPLLSAEELRLLGYDELAARASTSRGTP